jgi:phosphomannomutase/phosphoglucomutase
MNLAIFRAYDIRGIADVDLDDTFAGLLGSAYGTLIKRDGGTKVCVGRDPRVHSERLFKALVKGILGTGMNVIEIGVVPTPMLYFSVYHHDVDGGVQITGSHNPADYNGFKMMRGKSSLYGDQITLLRDMMLQRDFDSGEGILVKEPIFDTYVDYVTDNINLGPRALNLVVDAGNGAGGPSAMAILERLGVKTKGLFIEMDGTFPNHHPDPTVEANLVDLKRAVAETKADCGIAYDGDADRIGLIDENGEVIWGDRLLILLSREILKEHPGTPIVGEVKCSQTLFDDILAHGGVPIMSAVGHSIIKERMKKEGSLLAGEMSGHIFFAHRWFGFDDAVYATMRVLEILSSTDKTLSELLADVPMTCVTPEIRLDCPDDRKFGLVDEAITSFKATHEVCDIDGARIQFENGWGLIRASNTQPVLVLRAEAETQVDLDEIRGKLETFVALRS